VTIPLLTCPLDAGLDQVAAGIRYIDSGIEFVKLPEWISQKKMW